MVRPLRSVHALAVIVPLWLFLSASSARAQVAVFGHQIFCPKTTVCIPKPPKLKYKCVCPKPVCDPCSLPNYGYYPSCWRPWMQQVDYSHCPVPPPTVLAPHYHPREVYMDGPHDEPLQQPSQMPKLESEGPGQ